MPDTILIIEDYANDAKWLELTLKKAGVVNPIQTLFSAADAVLYIDGQFPYINREKYPLPKIIFLDLRLPGSDGFELLDWLKAHKKLDLFRVFVISGFEDMASVRKAYTMGATSFLLKPASPVDILNLIHTFPAHWSLSKSGEPPKILSGR